jgi:hypothetical protein
LSVTEILLFDFVIPKGQLQTADASACTKIATKCQNFSSFLLKKPPGIVLRSGGFLEVL